MNGSSDLGKSTSHEQAFKWLQQARDGRLEESKRQLLKQHLEVCPECQADAALERRFVSQMDPWSRKGQGLVSEEASQRYLQAARYALSRRWFWRHPLQDVGWVTAMLLLALVINWISKNLQIGGVSTPAAADHNPALDLFSQLLSGYPRMVTQYPQPGLSREGQLYLLAGGFILIFGLSLLISWRWKISWIYSLLIGLTGSAFLYVRSTVISYQISPLSLALFIPMFIAFLDATIAALWFNRHHWSFGHWLAAFVTFLVLGFVAANPGDFNGNTWEIFFFFLGFALLPLLTWQIMNFPGRWRWLSALIAAVWILGSLLAVFASYALNIHFPAWLTNSALILTILYPFVGTAAVGRIINDSLAAQTLSRQGLWLRLLAGFVLFASLFGAIYFITVKLSVNEDPIWGTILLLFVLFSSIVAGIAMGHHLSWKRLVPGLGLLLVLLVALIPSTNFSPDQTAVITEQRAVTINEAIQHYHQENAAYPPTLDALSPRYLLLVPRPVAYWTDTWCYVSGGDYYRLAYPYPTNWGYPNLDLHGFSAGNLPAGIDECKRVLNEWLSNR